MSQEYEVKFRSCLRLVVLLIFIFGTRPIAALNPDRLISQYIRRIFTTADGLGQNTVVSIIQTRDGYMWFGTQEGLARYNGYRFTNFRRKYTPGFISDYINDLYEDRRGFLWIATRGGLIRSQSNRFFPITLDQGLPSDIVYTLAEGPSGRLWIGTDRGLCSYSNGKITNQNWSLHLRINALKCSPAGTLWMGTDHGLYRRTGRDWIHLTDPRSIGDASISAIATESEGGLWAGTSDGSLYHLDQMGHITFSSPRISGDNQITSMKKDRDGAVWITTDGGGLLRIFKGRIETMTTDGGLPSNFIDRVFEDREGSLWFGTHKGIFLLQNSRFIVWTKVEGLSYDFISVVREDDRGNLLVGSYAGGLDRIDIGRDKSVFHYHDLPARKISALLLDLESRLWVGTRGEGLWLKEGRTWRRFTTNDGLSNDTVWVVYQDQKGAIWIGTRKGLNRYDGGQFVKYGVEDGLENDNIYAIESDLGGGIWIGTAGGGLHHQVDGSRQKFIRQPGLSDDVILVLLQDDDGVLWAGTSYGLNRIDSSGVTAYSEEVGLADNVVFSLLDDGRGYLWMSSNRGISRVSRVELERFHRRESAGIVSTQYGVDDGMKNAECNGGFQPAAWRTLKNLLCFPTVEGLVLVDPAQVDDLHDPPRVRLEDVVVNRKPVFPQSGMSLNPGVNRLEFHYAALTYRNPRKIHFRFRLDGYDRVWETVSGNHDRLVVYRYLPPGRYRFDIQASLDRGSWPSVPHSFEFQVLPFFWQTGWFKLVAIVGFALLSFLIISAIRKFLGIVAFWKRKTRIGKYRIIRQLGSGGMGTVYLAQSISGIHKQVALKVLREEFSADEIQIRRLEQEAELIDQIDHPNIVKIIERGKHDQNIFIAMEYLQGITLAQMISRHEKLDTADGIHILNQVVRALQTIHQKAIVHRDLKPDNIMVIRQPGDRMFVKLLDFGLARAETFTRLTESGIVLGTIAYLAPEQIRDSRFSPASDVYSLGVTGYEMFTGKRPFNGETSAEIMTRILNESPVEPRQLNKDIPRVLNGLILRMMNKVPDRRPEINEIIRVFSSLEFPAAQQPTTPIHQME